jgi:diguanylate cyclase (GGDEF)-like protein
MIKSRLFDVSLFFAALVIAFNTVQIDVDLDIYLKALLVFWIFSSLYYHLRIVNKSGSSNFDYGISYSISIGIFTGPLGLFIFEVLYRFTVYFTKKWTKTADPHEFLDTIYNIGSFVLGNTIAYYLFTYFYSKFQGFPFGFWIFMLILVTVTSFLTTSFLGISFLFSGDLKNGREVLTFITKSRSAVDIATVTLTNGLLLLFLLEEKWEPLICLFILNYLVSVSFVSKAQNIQNKLERDQFEQMAYTDFLTGIPNRAYMDKKIVELNQSGECIAIVVADIDKFKRINDNYNHAIGDQVIQHCAETLKSYLNEEDILFRSGGEEFTLFLRKRNFEQSLEFVETIRRGLEDTSVNVEFHSDIINLSYTASFGLYYFKINEQISMEKGYVYADHLLLQSKQLGRNRLSVKNGLLPNSEKDT